VTELRSRRQKAIADFIRSHRVASQEEVTGRLAELGYAVTQATVSRDLDQLGAVKVRRGGTSHYALPDQAGGGDWAVGRLQQIVAEWVRSVEATGNLLVLKMPPGSAHLVGAAIDQAEMPEVAGTISGDDTLFLALKDGVVAEVIAGRFRGWAGGRE
jgi:transcriptional regulator of arginine metabolism